MIFSSSESGINYFSLRPTGESHDSGELAIKKDELFLFVALEGQFILNAGYNNTSYHVEGESGINLFYPMLDWVVEWKKIDSLSEGMGLSIHLKLLHQLLTGSEKADLKEVIRSGIYQGDQSINEKPFILSPQMKMILRQLGSPPVGGHTIRPWIRSKIMELFSLLIDQTAPTSREHSCPFLNQTEATEKINLLRDYFLKNPDEKAGLDLFGQKFNMKAHSLKKGFKKAFKKSPKDFCQEVKMDRALELLKKEEITVGELAYKSGYSNTSHFIRSFKNRFGSTPSQFFKTKNNTQ